MLYRVFKIQTLTASYEVEAASGAEAEALVRNGYVSKEEDTDYDNETVFESEPA